MSFNVIEMFIFLVNDLSVFSSIVMSFHQKNKFFCFYDRDLSDIYQYQLPFCFLLGGQLSMPDFEKGRGSEKNECLGGLKDFQPWIFVWDAYYVSW